MLLLGGDGGGGALFEMGVGVRRLRLVTSFFTTDLSVGALRPSGAVEEQRLGLQRAARGDAVGEAVPAKNTLGRPLSSVNFHFGHTG